MSRYSVFLLIVLLYHAGFGQGGISPTTYDQVLQLQDTVALFDGRLLMVNVFKSQLRSLYEYADRPDSIRAHALTIASFEPYRAFWADYVGDSLAVRQRVILKLIYDTSGHLDRQGSALAKERIDRVFEDIAVRLERMSGHAPSGIWFVVFGSGATNLGGFGDGRMVLDLISRRSTVEHIRLVLPHELNHQIFDLTSEEDTSARGLYRCINEGFAVLVNQRLYGDAFSLSEYLQYTEEELAYCEQNIVTIFRKLKPYLLTSDRDHAQALANRSRRIFEQGPGAIGYFVGYKICDGYLKAKGEDRWTDLYTLPVREILAKSGY